MSKFEIASAHGRFQPLHNGHMEYLLDAKAACDYLWIGVTQYNRADLRVVPGAGAHRNVAANNPLSYIERYRLLHDALIDAGVGGDEFGVAPFPIENPDLLPEFLPRSVPVLTTICEDWNRTKVSTLTSHGYQVYVLWERAEKEVTGENVRRLIGKGDDSYKLLVPAATSRAVERLGLRERLRE